MDIHGIEHLKQGSIPPKLAGEILLLQKFNNQLINGHGV
jgi:hypothetical protein